MPEEPEIETNELQETVSELHEELEEERKEREADKLANAWTKWIALSTALLAVFAAIGALQSGALVNEAMIAQLNASDKWNEYQAARQKEYLFTIEANALYDRGVSPAAASESAASGQAAETIGEKKPKLDLRPQPPSARLAEYIAQIHKEQEKEPELRKVAEEKEKTSEESLHGHHRFAWSVALIQVAIALSAIAALTRRKPIWIVSLLIGAVGVVLFANGMLLVTSGGK